MRAILFSKNLHLLQCKMYMYIVYTSSQSWALVPDVNATHITSHFP